MNENSNDSSASSFGILGKRSSNDTSIEKLKAETDDYNNEESDEEQYGGDDGDKRERR